MPKYILDGKIDIEPLVTTRNFLARALKEAKTELEIAGTIQAFEVCYELAWKTCKKIISLRGVNYHTPKEVFRVAALDGLISDAERWFGYVDKRNITTHEYEQNILGAVYPILPKFLKDLDLLIKNLKKL